MAVRGLKYPQRRLDFEDAVRVVANSRSDKPGRLAFLNGSGKAESADPTDQNKLVQGGIVGKDGVGNVVLKRSGTVSVSGLTPGLTYYLSKRTDPPQGRSSVIKPNGWVYSAELIQLLNGDLLYLFLGADWAYSRTSRDGGKTWTSVDASFPLIPGLDNRHSDIIRLSPTHSIAPNRLVWAGGHSFNVGNLPDPIGVQSVYSDDDLYSFSTAVAVAHREYYPPIVPPPSDPYNDVAYNMGGLVEAADGSIVCAMRWGQYWAGDVVINRSNDGAVSWGAGLPSSRPIIISRDFTGGWPGVRWQTGNDYWMVPRILRAANDDLLIFVPTSSQGVWIYRSSDHGITWSIPTRLPLGISGIGVDESHPVAAQDGTLYIFMRRDSDGVHFWSKSVDSGFSWTSPQELSIFATDRNYRVSTVLDNGEAVVALYASGDAHESFRFLLPGQATDTSPATDLTTYEQELGVASSADELGLNIKDGALLYTPERLANEDSFITDCDAVNRVNRLVSYNGAGTAVESANTDSASNRADALVVFKDGNTRCVAKRSGNVTLSGLTPGADYYLRESPAPDITADDLTVYPNETVRHAGTVFENSLGHIFHIQTPGKVKLSFDGGYSFDDFNMNTGNLNPAGSSEDHVAIRLSATHPTAPNRIVVASAYTGGGMQINYSDTDGYHWRSDREGLGILDPIGGGNYRYPALVEADNGDIILAFHQFSGGDSIYAIISSDGGETWSGVTTILDKTAVAGNNMIRPVAVKANNGTKDLLVFAKDTVTGIVYFVRSTNNGGTWAAPVARDGAYTTEDFYSTFRIGNDIYWLNTNSSTNKLDWSVSVDHGVTWSTMAVNFFDAKRQVKTVLVKVDGEYLVTYQDLTGFPAADYPTNIGIFGQKGLITDSPVLAFGEFRQKIGTALDATTLQLSFEPAEDLSVEWYKCTSAEIVGNVVYLSSADTVANANATNTSKMDSIGFVAEKLGDTLCRVQFTGELGGFVGLTPLSKYYVTTVDGSISTSQPGAAGNVVQLVGTAKNATTLVINIGEGEVVP